MAAAEGKLYSAVKRKFKTGTVLCTGGTALVLVYRKISVFFNGADAFYGENLFRCEYRWRKSLQEQRILGSLFSENSFDRKEKAYRPHGRTYTCATAPMSRPSCRMGLPDMPCTMSPVFGSRRSFVTRSTILRWAARTGGSLRRSRWRIPAWRSRLLSLLGPLMVQTPLFALHCTKTLFAERDVLNDGNGCQFA